MLYVDKSDSDSSDYDKMEQDRLQDLQERDRFADRMREKAPIAIFSINELTMTLKIIDQCDVKHVMTLPIKQ
jgi:hypothetical protein